MNGLPGAHADHPAPSESSRRGQWDWLLQTGPGAVEGMLVGRACSGIDHAEQRQLMRSRRDDRAVAIARTIHVFTLPNGWCPTVGRASPCARDEDGGSAPIPATVALDVLLRLSGVTENDVGEHARIDGVCACVIDPASTQDRMLCGPDQKALAAGKRYPAIGQRHLKNRATLGTNEVSLDADFSQGIVEPVGADSHELGMFVPDVPRLSRKPTAEQFELRGAEVGAMEDGHRKTLGPSHGAACLPHTVAFRAVASRRAPRSTRPVVGSPPLRRQQRPGHSAGAVRRLVQASR